MPVVSLKEIVDRAFDGRYGVPAMNVVNDLTPSRGRQQLARAASRTSTPASPSADAPMLFGQRPDR